MFTDNYKILYTFLTASIITWLSVKPLIYITKKFNLFDYPDDTRKIHSEKIPTLGGISIFLGWLISVTLWMDFSICVELQYLILGVVLLAFLGIKDDISVLDPIKKFSGQIIAAIVLVIFGNIRITSFYSILGMGELPYWFSVVFTVLVFMTIINALNLIDGVNGLATTIALLGTLFYGIWFYLVGHNIQHTFVAAALCGSLLVFLRFNITPARLFMGDTGSMMLGFLLAFFSIDFIQTNAINRTHELFIMSSPTMAIAIIMLPLYDLFRVMFLRIIKGKNPFHADKNHIHHLLLRIGLPHMWVTVTLVLYSISIFALAVIFRKFNNHVSGIILLGYTIILNLILHYLLKRKEKSAH